MAKMIKINDEEYLFILKQDKVNTSEDLRNTVWIREDNSLDLDWWDECVFNNSEVRILADFRDKLKYAYACWYNDHEISDIIRKYIPEISNIYVPSQRQHRGNNLQEWCKKYNFTLEDFLINDKYIVICDYQDAVANILELFDWANIEHCDIQGKDITEDE